MKFDQGRRLAQFIAVIIGAAILPSAAGAEEPAQAELRAGAVWHDPGVLGRKEETGVSINAEALFPSPSFLNVLGDPRPHLGATVNTEGNTNQLYFGLTWDWGLSDRLFVEGSFGGAAHDGKKDAVRTDRKELGCRVLFRESLSLGYRITEKSNLSLMLDHISNAGLCDENEGLDGVALRYGRRF